jgi:hypothetical protein
MKTHHTKGPWIVVGTYVERHDGDGIYSRIAACYDTMICEEHGGTALANARLIAAAPDLLAALKACLAPLQQSQNKYGDISSASAFIVARAALAKAEGNQ